MSNLYSFLILLSVLLTLWYIGFLILEYIRNPERRWYFTQKSFWLEVILPSYLLLQIISILGSILLDFFLDKIR